MEKSDLKDETRIGYEIRTIHNLIGTHVRHHMDEIMPGLTPMQTWIIGFLYQRQDRDIYQRDIEEEFDISRATATKMLQLMEKKGLIVRRSVAHDGRLKKIFLTQAAIDCHKDAIKDMQRTEEILTQGMTQEEVLQLKRFLLQMHQNIASKIEEDV